MLTKTLLFSVFLSHVALCQDTAYIDYFRVGETIIPFYSETYHANRSRVAFLNVHGNELTSIRAAEAYLSACGGTLTHILNEQERLVTLYVDGKEYLFDPNRIYSMTGRGATLKKLSLSVSKKVQSEVAGLANKVSKFYLQDRSLIIALHNNNDSDLSVLSYQEEQTIRKHWGAVFVNPDMDPDDFILTTEKHIYNRIREKNINVIWENTSLIRDDGSLSIYAGLRNIPYINIEAEHEHLEEQLAMLNALDDIIQEYSKKSPPPKNKEKAGIHVKKPPATGIKR